MENLDFGWGFAVIVLAVMLVGYYTIMVANYLLVVFIGGKIKKLTETSSLEISRPILATALPYVLAAVIVQIALIPLDILLDIFSITRNGLFGSLNTGHLSHIIEMTCLALTRFSYSRDWRTLGRLQTKRIIFNFILWSTFALILLFGFKSLPDYTLVGHYLGYLYPLLVPGMTFLFLKVRNVEKPVRELKY